MAKTLRPHRQTYKTDRLSSIPTMASAISKKISLFKQQHRQLVDESIVFFENYVKELSEMAELRKRITAYDKQITIIQDYKTEHGKLPQIKDQKSTDKYLRTLYNHRDKFAARYDEIRVTTSRKRSQRYESLDHLADNMIDLLDGQKIFSQFLGTIALSTPLPEEKIRCVRNEKFKPIYIAGLVVALFEEVRRNYSFKNTYLDDYLTDIFGNDKTRYMAQDESAMSPETKIKYREEVLKPIAKAALLQSIGSYAPEVEAIFQGDRYRMLSQQERDNLIGLMHKKSVDYIKLGIGVPDKRFDRREEREEYVAFETRKMRFMISILDSQNERCHELGDLLRIPMVYSSFMVSTKPDYDYRIIYKAYDIIEEGIETGQYNDVYARLFLQMVGRFPLGSGVYFISKETDHIERGIVSSLYPDSVDEPVCKQITRHQVQSLSQTEVIVGRNSNIFYEDVRIDSKFEDIYFQHRYQGEFTWNANELWEVQVPAITFWKKDGTRKVNSIEEDTEDYYLS